MKKSFKSIVLLLIDLFVISIVILSCNSNSDPYDGDFPSAKWTPKDLHALVEDNRVQLTWEQSIAIIDGFIIERSNDSLNWEFLTKKMIDGTHREYIDTTIITGEIYFYRIYAKAGTNISNYCYSDVVIVPLQLPTVITSDVSGIESNSVIFNGAVTKDGGKPVIERGFCYSLKSLPTVNDQKIAVGTGTGVFTKMVQRLNYGTTYYLRAFAKNDNGIAYGKEIEFKTLAVLAYVGNIEIGNIDSSSVNLSGEVRSDGRGVVAERGFCYSEFGEPNYDSQKKVCGTGVGEFSSSLNELKWATTYFVRAYAVNEIGVSYGKTLTFFTKCDCEKKYGHFIDKRDSKNYRTIKIGDQTWMAENLKYIPYSYEAGNWKEGDACYTPSGYDGVFYNIEATTTACPSGWNLPTDQDWEILTNYLIVNGYNYDHSFGENKIAKSLAYDSGWQKFNENFDIGQVGYNQYENNTSCFSAKAGNVLYYRIHYRNTEGTTSYWWSRSSGSDHLSIKGFGSYSKSLNSPSQMNTDGLFIRCIKD